MSEKISENWTMDNMLLPVLLEEYLVYAVPYCFYLCDILFTDMIKRRNLRTQNIKILVLDEADEMLNQGTPPFVSPLYYLTFFISYVGFQEQIYDVYRYLPPSTQVSHMIFVNNHM